MSNAVVGLESLTLPYCPNFHERHRLLGWLIRNQSQWWSGFSSLNVLMHIREIARGWTETQTQVLSGFCSWLAEDTCLPPSYSRRESRYVGLCLCLNEHVLVSFPCPFLSFVAFALVVGLRSRFSTTLRKEDTRKYSLKGKQGFSAGSMCCRNGSLMPSRSSPSLEVCRVT